MSTPPGQSYVYRSSSTVTSASEFKVEVNGVVLSPVDITGSAGDWTITIAAAFVACPEEGDGSIKIYHRDGGGWDLEHTETIAPCS